MFPFIDLRITSVEFGSISVFDFISYFALLFTLEDFFIFSWKKSIYFFLFSALAVLIFIGSVKSEFIVNSFFNFLKYLSIFIYSKMLIDECLKDPSFINLVIKSLKLSCVLSLVFLVIQLIIGMKFTFYSELNPNIYAGLGSDTLRYASYFQDPQKYGQYLSMLGFLFLMNRKTKPNPEKLNVVLFILVVIAILLTGCRSAFLGMCMGLLIILLFKKSKILIIAFFCCLFGYFIITYFSSYFSFFNRNEDYSTSAVGRYEIWNGYLQIFFTHPFLGIGIGNIDNYIVKYSIGGYYFIGNKIAYYGPENGYLQLLIEFGLLGFIFVFILILIPVINAIRSYLRSHNSNIILLIASVISWMVAFTTVDSLVDKRILVVLVTLLCLLIVSKNPPKAIHV